MGAKWKECLCNSLCVIYNIIFNSFTSNNYASDSDAPGGAYHAFIGGVVAAVVFIVVLIAVIILVTVVCVKRRKGELNGITMSDIISSLLLP